VPVRKFRSLQEMEDSLSREPGALDLLRAIASVWSFAARTCPRRFPPGVYRHRTIEDAECRRELWEEENFRLFWARRRLDPRQLDGDQPRP
jgi:hypothetical protein